MGAGAGHGLRSALKPREKAGEVLGRAPGDDNSCRECSGLVCGSSWGILVEIPGSGRSGVAEIPHTPHPARSCFPISLLSPRSGCSPKNEQPPLSLCCVLEVAPLLGLLCPQLCPGQLHGQGGSLWRAQNSPEQRLLPLLLAPELEHSSEILSGVLGESRERGEPRDPGIIEAGK